jgi:hypothetical protein
MIILDGTKGETFPSWTTGTRPASPNAGQTGYNTTTASLEFYNGTAWVSASGGGGGTPGGSSGQIQYNNSSSFGGITNITVASGQTTARIDPRVFVGSNSATTLTPDISQYDMYVYEALSTGGTLTINAPTGTPLNGDKIMFRFADNGFAVTLSWNAIYRLLNVTIPTTTATGGKLTYVGCIYNSYDSKWDVISSGTSVFALI